MYQNNHIGIKLRKIRELKNLKQKYIAQHLGISSVAYGKIERGETDVSIGRLEKIASLFELSLQQLLNFDETQIFNLSENTKGKNLKYVHNNSPEEIVKLLYEVASILDKISQRLS